MIRRAVAADLPAIQSLCGMYKAYESMPKEYINGRDLCLVYEEAGEIVGYIWAGLMARSTVAYVGGFVVHPTHSHKGIGAKLARNLLGVARGRGVKSFVAMIKQDDHHDKSAVACLRTGAGAEPLPCTFIRGNLSFMHSQLKELEHGRR